jgi:hypothetical protein
VSADAPSAAVLRRRRLALLVLAAVVVLALVAVVVRACSGGTTPPASEAAAIAPSGTLVFVDLSTDRDREAVQKATELLGRFGGYEPRRDDILRRLSGADKDVDLAKDVQPWLGDEAALALTEQGTATAGSLVIIRVTDEEKAQAFMRRNPRRTAVGEYKGDAYEEYGRLTVAIKSGWMLIGQTGTIKSGLDAINRRGVATLAGQDPYKRAIDGLPEARVGTVYASAAGLRRLLAPQAGLIGGISVLFDQPGLQSLAVSVEAEDEGARMVVNSALDPAERRRIGAAAPKPFSPSLAGDVPEGALAYFGVNGVSGALQRILAASAGGANAGGLGPILQLLQRELQKQTEGDLERNLLRLFEGEAALVVERAVPAPIISLVTRSDDPDGTARTLAQLEQPVAKLLTPKGEEAPTWGKSDLGDGVTANTLTLPTGAAVSYAVLDERLVLSTSADGIRRIKESDDGIDGAERFEDVLGDRSDEVGSLGFLDFSQLLELGEQTGLNDSRAYLAARDDLQKIRAVGFSSTGDEDSSTAEIRLSIP